MSIVSVRDKRVAPQPYRYVIYNRNNSVYSDTWYQPTTAKCVGSYKYIDSVRGTPPSKNKLVLNPVTIRTASGRTYNGYAEERNAPSPCRFLEASGPWISKHYDMQISGLDNFLNDEAIVKSRAGINQAQLDLGVMLGELGETLQMLRSPFASLRGFLSRVANKPPIKRIAPSLDVMSNTWLEYRYGVMPLIQDVSAIQNEIATIGRNVRRSESVERSGASKQSSSVQNIDGPVQNFTGKVQKIHTVSRKATCVSYFQKLWESDMRGQPQYWGFSPWQLPATLWELLPGSFLVDWSWTVGPWLQAITPNPSVRHLGGCVSQVIHDHVEVSQLPLTRSCSGFYAAQKFVPSTWIWDCKTLIRLTNPMLPDTPVPRARILNFSRILDSCSIAWNEIITLGRRR